MGNILILIGVDRIHDPIIPFVAMTLEVYARGNEISTDFNAFNCN